MDASRTYSQSSGVPPTYEPQKNTTPPDSKEAADCSTYAIKVYHKSKYTKVQYKLVTFHALTQCHKLFPDVFEDTEFDLHQLNSLLPSKGFRDKNVQEKMYTVMKNFFVLLYPYCDESISAKALININSKLEGFCVRREVYRADRNNVLKIFVQHVYCSQQHILVEFPIKAPCLAARPYLVVRSTPPQLFTDGIYNVDTKGRFYPFRNEFKIVFREHPYPPCTDSEGVFKKVVNLAGLDSSQNEVKTALKAILYAPPFRVLLSNCVEKLNPLTTVASMELKIIVHPTDRNFHCVSLLQHDRPICCLRVMPANYDFRCNQQYYDAYISPNSNIGPEQKRILQSSISPINKAATRRNYEQTQINDTRPGRAMLGAAAGSLFGSAGMLIGGLVGASTGEVTKTTQTVTRRTILKAFEWVEIS